MPRTPNHAKRFRDVNANRDVIVGNQYNTADLTRVEKTFDEIVALLRAEAFIRVEGNVRDSVIIVGDENTAVRFAAVDLPILRALSATDPRRREEIYLTALILDETYAQWDRLYLPLAGRLAPAQMPSGSDDPFHLKMRLADRADQGISAAGIPLKDIRTALDELAKSRLVILGEPGAGKTTTLHRLMLDLTRQRLQDPSRKLPFRADLAGFIGDKQLPADFLKAKWDDSGLVQTYGEATQAGQVCFLLDGINQMPLADRPERIKRWAQWAGELRQGNWAVFTCRTADFVPLLGLPEVRVQTLDDEQIRRYFALRFSEARAAELWNDFEKRLRGPDDRFERVARNPFMLAQLAERCDEGKSLTESRAILMQDLAKRLLDRELMNQPQTSVLASDPMGTFNAEMDALSQLAYAAQARGEGTDFTRADAEHTPLGDRGGARLSLDEVLDLAMDATLVEEKEIRRNNKAQPGFSFYHQLLQEYFAARELLRRFRANKNLTQSWRVPWRQWQFMPKRFAPGEYMEPPPTTGWEETIVMASGLAGKDTARLIAAVRKENLPLAGRCLAESGIEDEQLKASVDEIRAALLVRQRDQAAHLRARIGAGLALGELGHPDLTPRQFEFEGRMVWAIVPPMQPVPAGEFIRGSARGDKRAYSDEFTDERRVTLPDFSIGRYLVTNAEFAWFIEAGGYKTDRWWSDAGREWKHGGPDAHKEAMQDWLSFRSTVKQQKNIDHALTQVGLRPQDIRYWKEIAGLSEDVANERASKVFDRHFDRPGFWDYRELSSPARPVVGVNWFEAEAYCNWLSAVTGQTFRLPHENEWEKAARGTEGRDYPWGEKFDSKMCNTIESHIYTTTPVGLYPGGASPFGLFDASGNVREWTVDWYQMHPGGETSEDFGEKFKIVRGGSWGDNHRDARCAFRYRDVLVDFFDSLGFRVLSHDSDKLPVNLVAHAARDGAGN